MTLSKRSPLKFGKASGGEFLAERWQVAATFVERWTGLIGKSGLASGEGLFFPRCNSIHMWFMRFPIDVVFVDSQYRVTSVYRELRPWRVFPVIDFRASHALELPVGSVERAGVRKGDVLCSS
jgi:uncharacterized membrane protein (UPF0127 family)